MLPVEVNTAPLLRNWEEHEELNDDVEWAIVGYVNDFEEKHRPSQGEMCTPTVTANGVAEPVPASTTPSAPAH